MNFRRVIIVLMSSIVLSILLSNMTNILADTNVDTGGGSTGGNTGSTTNVFSSGDFGVRFTVVDGKTGSKLNGTKSIDFYKKSNKTEKSIYHFKASNKLQYLNGIELTGKKDEYVKGNEAYAYYAPNLWNVIESSYFGKKASLDEITEWLNDSGNLQKIAQYTQYNYSKLTDGSCKLIVEPVFYVTYGGKYYAMTAHEIAKYDELLNGDLKRKFGTYSHKNIPLSLFLKTKTFGIQPWMGSKTSITTNDNIKKYLGIAVMSWREPDPDVEIDPVGEDYVYRADTDVITSIDITTSSEANPDNPITVVWDIPGVGRRTQTGILIPKGYTQKVWVKWHTPNTPGTIVIDVSSNGGSVGQIICKVKKLGWWEPLNPTADDKKPKNFNLNADPTVSKPSAIIPIASASWTRWERCVKERELIGYQSIQTGTDAHGNPTYTSYPIYEYYWHFGTGTGRGVGEPSYYYARLGEAKLELSPAEAASRANPTKSKLKSGYGVSAKLITTLNNNMPSAVTDVQTGVFYFPEFEYKNYWRLGNVTRSAYDSTIELPVNTYSRFGNRVHFTPVWFPDGEYKIYSKFYDAWTPVGMLQGYATGSVEIKGSVYDDYHIGPALYD